MSRIGQIEPRTQARVVKLLRERLGYRYLGDWSERTGNANIETVLVRDRGTGAVDALPKGLRDNREAMAEPSRITCGG